MKCAPRSHQAFSSQVHVLQQVHEGPPDEKMGPWQSKMGPSWVLREYRKEMYLLLKGPKQGRRRHVLRNVLCNVPSRARDGRHVLPSAI